MAANKYAVTASYDTPLSCQQGNLFVICSR